MSSVQFLCKAVSKKCETSRIRYLGLTNTLGHFDPRESIGSAILKRRVEIGLVSRLTPGRTLRLASLRKGMALVDGHTQKPPTFVYRVRTRCI